MYRQDALNISIAAAFVRPVSLPADRIIMRLFSRGKRRVWQVQVVHVAVSCDLKENSFCVSAVRPGTAAFTIDVDNSSGFISSSIESDSHPSRSALLEK